MDRLFKVSNAFRSVFDGRTPDDPQREKLELTLTWHETMFSSQTGVALRKQSVIVALLDNDAQQCSLKPGDWLVGNVSLVAFDSHSTPGRQTINAYLNRYIIVTDQTEL